MKILEEIENKDKIKEILDTIKIIKSKRKPQNLKKKKRNTHLFYIRKKNNTRSYQMQKYEI